MTATNRSKLIAKLHAALKKHYKIPPAAPSRPLLEHALYACLLEDCPSDLADDGIAKLEQDYFDWNEVRVTTVTELSNVLSSLPDPNKAASRLKATLQGIFEEFYSFDLDHLKKENLGKAVAKFEKLSAISPFVLSYVIQHGLGGHSIPIDYSAMVLMLVTGVASQGEASDGRVPGLERAIPKSKGMEFASLLHQPAVALSIDAHDDEARKMLESVVKGSTDELDQWLVSKEEAKKRVAKRKAEEREVAKQEAAAIEEEKPVAVTPVKKKPIRSAAKSTSTTNKPKSAKKKAAAAKSPPPAAEKSSAVTKDSSETIASAKSPKADSSAKTSGSKKETTSKKSAIAKATSSDNEKSKPTGTKSGKNSAASTSSEQSAEKTDAVTESSGDSDEVDAEVGKKAANRKLSKRKPR